MQRRFNLAHLWCRNEAQWLEKDGLIKNAGPAQYAALS